VKHTVSSLLEISVLLQKLKKNYLKCFAKKAKEKEEKRSWSLYFLASPSLMRGENVSVPLSDMRWF
jgi:hypothetical protein